MARTIVKTDKPVLISPLDMKQLGEYLRYKRTSANLQLVDVASMCGLSKQTYQNIEHGRGTTRIDSVLKACEILGVDLFIKDNGDQ